MPTVKFIIGITGGSGVGKTTLIQKLHEKFPDKLTTFSLDNYYKPKSLQALDKNGIVNFDLPTALDTKRMNADLTNLLNDLPIEQKVYGFNNPANNENNQILSPKSIILIEGLFVMYYPFIKQMLDYSVYITVSEKEQLERRLKRDISERNYSEEDIMYQWTNHVLPSYTNYIKPVKGEAHLIIKNNEGFDDNIHTLMHLIHQKIES